MGFDFSGFVLRAPRTAPSNFKTTDEASNGVDRDFKPLSSDYALSSPGLVELSADQYRAAVLLRGEDGQTEYLLWAANTSNLADVVPFSVDNEGTVTFPRGLDPVVTTQSAFGAVGTHRAIIVDDGDRSIESVSNLIVRRGDTGAEVQIAGSGEFNPVSGVFTITDAATLATLGGGLSEGRGDKAVSLTYAIAAPTFWWSRNDRYENRFKWDGRVQRWVPLRGTPPRNLGALFADTDYTLSPAPITILPGDFLPGDSSDPDVYAMVRLGSRPDASSFPVAQPVGVSGFGGIKVVTEEEIEEFDFGSEPTLAGAVGQATGVLKWNPAFVEEFAGQTIFYSYQGFSDQEQVEALGPLEDADLNLLFVAPIPGPTDYPFIRVGSRSPLQVVFANTEALLAVLTIEEGEVGIALSTGRLKFSSTDVAKADPEDPGFDENYLGAQVFYDGVSVTQRPVPIRHAVPLVNDSGNPTVVFGKDQNLYIPDAVPTPAPGTSGVTHVPDTTGTIPNTDSDAGIRFGNGSGLLREIEGPWDVVLFTENGQISTIRTFDDDDEIPRFRFRIPRGTAYVDKRKGAGGSEVVLGRQDLKRFDGKQMYFLQSGVQPAMFAREAAMWAKVRNTFTLVGDEVFVFAVDGDEVTWDAATDPGGILTSEGGTFTTEEIATSLNAVTISGTVRAQNGRLVIETTTVVNNVHYGRIEIGYGPGGVRDLSGAAAVGFLPGWVIRTTTPETLSPPPNLQWLPDNGTHLGVFRSPFNLNGRKDDVADINHIGRFDDVVLLSTISASPIVFLDRPPLEDVAGYDEGIFFRIQDGLVSFNLENFDEVFYEFGFQRFSWADEHRVTTTLEQPVDSLDMEVTDVIPESYRLPSKGLRLSVNGSPLEDQTLNEDFKMLADGAPGIAVLVDTVGALKSQGGRAFFTEDGTTFTDNSADIDFVELGVKAGWQIKITQGDAEGTYIVAADATQTNSLTTEQQFPVSGSVLPWQLYDGVTRDEFDPGIVADAQYLQFQHLPEEPFKVRVLSKLGEVPADATAQSTERLDAVLGDALRTGRSISIRFGLPVSSPTAVMVALQQDNLGVVLNSRLEVPTPDSQRFADEDFSIRLGTKTYTFADGNLVKVPGALSFPLVGDVIEVQETTGHQHIGTDVFVQIDGQDVIYVEEFLTPAGLSGGTVEYRSSDGLLNFSVADMQKFGGTDVYLVEQMVTQSGQDATLNPIQGSLYLTTSLREFQIVEGNYFRAEVGTGSLLLEPSDPDDPESAPKSVEITEQLPLFVRLDPAAPEGSGSTESRWAFNPTERTVDEEVEPLLYVGSTLYNIGSSPAAGFEIDNDADIHLALLEEPVDSTSEVFLTYAVFEAFGGEQSFTVSQPPVFRPPFRIEANKTKFVLETDRTGDVTPGKLLRVGAFAFYITKTTFDVDADVTTVEFIPETEVEAGSRDPASASLSLLSDIVLATAISPDAPEGYWAEVTALYEPVNRGFNTIIFHADITAVAVIGHLLELGELPFIIAGAALSPDGNRTEVELTSFFPRGFAFGQDIAKISVRPVYQPQPLQLIGRGAVFVGDPTEVILFGEKDAEDNVLPGRTLRPSIDYELNTDDGSVELLDPPEGPLQPTQVLYLRHTRQRVIAPLVVRNVFLNPRFTASFVSVVEPSEENNRLDKILRGTYTFSNPDTFFYRTVPLLTYLGEVADQVAQDVAALLPSVGPAPAIIPPADNATQGRLGFKSQRRDLEDTDRAGRVFLDFYNVSNLGFDQVTETITGNIIGDRDGKFQFFVGRDKELPPPGYEDAISGELNPRNLFSEVFFGYNPKATYMRRDPVVDPTDFTIDGDQLEGPFIDPDYLGDLQRDQIGMAKNDVDDVVMFARTRKRLRRFPRRLEAFGRYRRMGEPSIFSRLFPEAARFFTLTDPGIGADLEADPVNPGVYAFRKRVKRLSIKGKGNTLKIELPKRASTFFKPIADIGNPVLGQFENIGGVFARPRLPRARIFLYSAVGFPEFDEFIIGFPTFASSPRPAVIATPLPLHELPLGENGLPDVLQLAAQGGETIDLTTGDPDLFTPGWHETDAGKNVRPKITFGRPDGRIIDVQTGESFSFDFPSAGVGTGDPETFTVSKSVFVGEVILGCIVTFATEDHIPGDNSTIIKGDSDLLEVAEDPAASNPPIELFQGDTVFVTPSDADVNAGGDPDDPSTKSNTEAQLEGLPNFRTGFDVGVDNSNGEFRDITFPSFNDPSIFGIKELLGQKPPLPFSNIEGGATFRNGDTEPAAIPALSGGFTNDSGDYTLPYLYAPNTEIEQLGIVQGAFADIFADTGVPSAAYPDEIQGADGAIFGAFAGGPPAALVTQFDVTPVATAGSYTRRTGIGDVRPFDILLMETGQAGAGLPASSQGILGVGHVEGGASGSAVEPPRFVTPTVLGDTIKWRLKSAMTFLNQTVVVNPPGMVITEPVVGTTNFDITQISTGFLVFNDGVPASPTGGLNNFLVLGSGNVLTITLWTAASVAAAAPVAVDTIVLDFGVNTATSGTGASGLVAGSSATDNVLSIRTAGSFLTIGFLPPPVIPEDPTMPGESVPLWFTIDIDLTAGASTTGYIEEDRLTLNEAFDMRSVLPRTEPNVLGTPVFSELSVTEIESSTTTTNTVNGDAETNGGVPFTFLARSSAYPFVGDFVSVTGRGTLRVMGFEGHGNVPIVSTDTLVFSAIPSSEFAVGNAVEIAVGTGIVGTASNRNFRVSSDGVTTLTATTGALADIKGGDLLNITGDTGAPSKGITQAGSYLVKHALEPNDLATTLSQYRRLLLETTTLPSNTKAGWAAVDFPELVSMDLDVTQQITISRTLLESDGTTSAFDPAGGTLYFIVIPDPEAVGYSTTNLKIDYTAVDTITNTFLMDPTTAWDFAETGVQGNADVLAALNALTAGVLVTGFFRFDVFMDRVSERFHAGSAVPEVLPRNVVGYDSGPAATTRAGFVEIAFTGKGGGSTILAAGLGEIVLDVPPGVDEVAVFTATPIANTAFVDNENAYVYDDVPQYLELDQSGGNTYWDTLHAASAAGVFAPLPGDTFTTSNGALAPGFYAQAGVFLEPSWPRPTLDLGGVVERVVDASNSVAVAGIGFRDGTSFGEGATEPCSWEIRRMRRFNEVLTTAGALLAPLRFVYEIRSGTVDAFGEDIVGPQSTNYPFVVTSNGGTQLGGFDDDLVNVNPGDSFLLFDDDGETLLESVEIGGIEGPDQIWLKQPGITVIPEEDVEGKPFQIYLRKPPVPHEQSNNELLDLITQEVLLDRRADMPTQTGGFVNVEKEPTDPRRLRDTGTPDDVNYAALGVQVGDIVVIDSTGLLVGPGGVIPATGQERASRPFGDRSVPNRTIATAGQEVPFLAGGPSEVDDNRGWYRVTEVGQDNVAVSSQTEFSNDPGGGFVTFGIDAEYAVLPTVSGSTAPFADPPGGPGVEGQLDLRPTAFAGDNGSAPNSFRGNLYSIAPFSYRIIRPNSLFSDDAVDLVLLMRERTLSFLEEFDVFFRGDKFGTYFVFQRDEHVGDLGNPLIPDEGKGVMSNELIDGVRGLINISPFANTTDSLSVLDRRFWVNDFRLDAEFPPGSGAATPSYATLESNANNLVADEGDGRPVLTDRIEDILNDDDQLREFRFAWLNFRVNRENGTLALIRRFLEELPKKRREELKQLRLSKSLEEAGS